MVIPRQPALHDTHVSPIGLVPKGHSGTAWRMIVDLSHPRGRSLNDLISPDVCTLSYPSIDDAVDFVVSMGRYTQLVKIDLKSAYRILPIHPADRVLLGISWEGQVYLDGCLPCGLRSAPKIFTAFSDAVAWTLFSRGVRCLIHHLDDFLLFGTPFFGEAQAFLSTTLATFSELSLGSAGVAP